MTYPSPNRIVRIVSGLRRHPVATGLLLTSLLVLLYQLRPHPQPLATPTPKHAPLADTHLDPRTAPPDHPENTMSSGFSDALGFTGELPLEACVRKLMEINGPLTASEIEESFRALLALPESGEPLALRATWFHELANLLQRQKLDQRAFGEVLASAARNSRQDLATRDYALQHLRRIWEKSAADKELRLAIEATFGEMIAPRNPLMPTALLSLHLLDPAGSATNFTMLVQAVSSVLEDPKITGDDVVRARMAAARIAGERQLAGSRGPLLKLATAPSGNVLVRMAAISALGRFGDPSDLNTLAALSPSDERLIGAIRHATSMGAGK